MKVVVGLGNPGSRYASSRHNVGFMVARRLARRWDVDFAQTLCESKVARGDAAGEAVRLVLPQTMMNRSGEAVASLLQRWRLETESVLVICDDLSLPLGKIRLRKSGSDGGHRGLRSILEKVGSEGVPRLRIGIRGAEMPSGELTPFVLEPFAAGEKRKLEGVLQLAEEAVSTWVKEGLTSAMNRFNKKAGSSS
ncbi:MAG: aminoacyl-tRNA hydrolase [Candidatus Omnitrophica bacterium]|nr:aminoacyl-tRNA hydrolase [Candidatus Omnitrophota bacterium]